MSDEQKAHAIQTQYDLGQNIWRRPSLTVLLRRIETLENEIAAAEKRGHEMAKEQAAKAVNDLPWMGTREQVIANIRAMQPEQVAK